MPAAAWVSRGGAGRTFRVAGAEGLARGKGMPVPSAESPASRGKPPAPLWQRLLFHPLMSLPAFVLLTQELEEKVYPFSHFPMYSNPADWDDYIYLTDAAGQVVPITHHTGLSAAKLNKILNNKMKEVGLKSSQDRREAVGGLEETAGRDVLERARRLAERRQRPLPRPVRLHRVIIERRGTELVETPHQVAEG